MKLFEYAIILQEKKDNDGNVVEPAVLLAKDHVLAKDVDQAQVRIARLIPEEHLSYLERVDLAIRPF